MKTVLLNPPASQNIMREYFCCKTTKASTLIPPVDLIQMSGTISAVSEVVALDCVCLRMNADQAIDIVAAHAPTAVICVVGSITWHDDVLFLASLRRRIPGLRIAIIGDIAISHPEQILAQTAFVDAVVLNTLSSAICAFVAGKPIDSPDMQSQQASSDGREAPPRTTSREICLPVPRHDLFMHRRYRYPFCRRRRFAAVLTDYGCPFACGFCLHGSLTYHRRTIGSVAEELAFIRKLGISEIYFSDQTFGHDRERTAELASLFCRHGIGWVAFSRADVLVRGVIPVLAKGGCHTVIVGIESANEDVRAGAGKAISNAMIKEAIGQCRSAGIRTVGTFLLGLPGETPDSLRQTLAFAKSLKLDFCSWNVLVPKVGTAIGDRLTRGATGLGIRGDQSSCTDTSLVPGLSGEKLSSLRSRLERSFYMRPSYIVHRLFNVSSLWEVECGIRSALSIMGRGRTMKGGRESR